ncbi:hypothetical protein ACHAXT_008396 [Thalassiosira profunda]
MGGLADNPLILSLASWAWGSDPNRAVTPRACLDSLPFLETPCLTRLVAKGIGVGIILLSCVNRAPVIRNILKSRSATGLSVAAVYGEVIMYSNASFYNILQGNPFTAYGETFMVLLQIMVVVSLIWTYEPQIGMANKVAALASYGVYVFLVFQVLTPETQYILMVGNPVVLIQSRGAQIRANFANKQTGAQSLITTAMNLSGSLVRMATTIKEVGWDMYILRAYGISVCLNAILFGQIVAYKANTEKLFASKKKKE